MNIIIVDDEPKIRNGLSKLIGLNETMNIIGTFEDGESALDFLQTYTADVLLTDIRMDGMTGLELIRSIRKINQDIAIIILSGYGDFNYAQEAIELNVHRFLTKPTNTTELMQVLDNLNSNISTQQPQQDILTPVEVDHQTIEQTLTYLHQNYAQKITLKQLALAMHISPNYLCRLFKEHTQQGINEYLTNYRMQQAKKLLKYTKQSIKNIAEQVGYTDVKYFSVSFKKHLGHTPMEYRNKKRNFQE